MNFIYVIHLMCWNYLIALIDLITHSRNRNNRNNSGHGNNEGGRARSARPPFVAFRSQNAPKKCLRSGRRVLLRVFGRFFNIFGGRGRVF